MHLDRARQTIRKRPRRFQYPGLEDQILELLQAHGRPDESLFAALMRLARSPETGEQASALLYLGHLRYVGATDFLIDFIHERAAKRIAGDCELQTVGNACESLGRIDTATGHAALKSIYETCPDFWTRYMTLDAMGWEVEHSEPEYVIAVIRSRANRLFRQAAMWAVVEQSSLHRFALYEQVVIEALADRSPDVRILALDALGRSGQYRLRHHAHGLVRDRGRGLQSRTTVASHARYAFDILSSCEEE